MRRHRQGNSTLPWIKPFIIDADVSVAIGILTNVFLHGPLGASRFQFDA
jgi:hypothetical protein